MSYSKYLIYQKQVSYDGGQTWEDVEGETTYSGSPIETYDSESGCVLDGGYKYLIVDTSGNTAYKGCDGNDVLTEHDIIDTGGMIGGWDNPTHLYIGNCVKTVNITENASIGYFSGITFSRSVKNINAIVGYRNFKSAGYQIEQTLTIPNTVETIANSGAYWENHGFQAARSIIFENNSHLSLIGDYAFNGCTGLTSFNIPNGVTSIGGHAFAGCTGITSIVLPDGVTVINGSLFEGCTSLSSVTIGSGVTSIGYGAFSGCTSLSSVTIPSNTVSIGQHSFANAGLTSITIPDSVTNIDYHAFYQCPNLESVFIGSGVTEWGQNVFRCPLTSITVSSNNTKFDSRNNCNAVILTSASTIILGSSSTVIPDGIVELNNCFNGNLNVTDMTIPSSVTNIYNSFYGCSNLNTITFLSNDPPTMGKYAFYLAGDFTAYVPRHGTNAYRTAFNATNGHGSITIIEMS